MCTTKRKTGFIGFLIAIKSTKKIFHDMVESPQAPLKYLLTYKLSKDHLELFFGAIRSAGGFNNNPTAQQFTAAYKRLLLRSSIEGGKGNCEKRDPIDILHVLGDSCNVNDEEITITNAALIRKYDLQERSAIQSDYTTTVMLQISLTSQNTRRLQFLILLVMLQKWPRSSCYACIVAKHLAQKITLHLQILWNSRTGVNFLRQQQVSSKSAKKRRNVLREC